MYVVCLYTLGCTGKYNITSDIFSICVDAFDKCHKIYAVKEL